MKRFLTALKYFFCWLFSIIFTEPVMEYRQTISQRQKTLDVNKGNVRDVEVKGNSP